jgi:hypothetical protein
MISTRRYRGRQFTATGLAYRQEEAGEGQYYPTRHFGLANLQLVDRDAQHVLMTISSHTIGTLSDRWGSWTAWDACGFFALLGDFVLYCETEQEGMYNSGDDVHLARVYLVQPEHVDGTRADLRAGMSLLNDFSQMKRDARRWKPRVASVSVSQVDMGRGLRDLWLEDLQAGPVRYGVAELDYDADLIEACGGAALVCIDGVSRWLVPHADGPLAALARARSTEPRDDWALLAPLVVEASAAERARVAAHFEALGDMALWVEVQTACAGLAST